MKRMQAMFDLIRRPKPRYYGLNDLDKKLERYVDYDGGFYVELGANDGISQSNSYYFEQSRGWRGVLIEPAPHNFLKCNKLRGAKNEVHCRACVSYDFPEKFVELTYANLMTLSVGIDNDLDDVDQHIAAAQPHMRAGEKSFRFGALAATLNSILQESKAPNLIDFLSLDVEGVELEVLKGINHEEYRFKFLLIECRKVDQLSDYLNGAQYKLVDQFSQHDYLFQNTRM